MNWYLVVALSVLVLGLGAPSSGIKQRKSSHSALNDRTARPRVDLNARKEYYRKRFKDEACVPYPPPPNQPDLPTVPNSFMTEMEIAFQDEDRQRIIYGQENYNGALKRGVLTYDLAEGIFLTRPTLLKEEIHYNVDMDEALFIYTTAGCEITGQENCESSKYCNAGTMDSLRTELQSLFGIVPVSGANGFLGASSILEFGPEFNYTAHSVAAECHGMDCNVFDTCLLNPNINASLLYTYYWTTDHWHMQNNGDRVPVAVEIYGTGAFDGQTTKELMMRYDFFNYRREFMPTRYELEPPVDVYCRNRVTHLSPPPVVESFSFRSEIVSGIDIPMPSGDNDTILLRFRSIFPKDEWYDWRARVTRQDYLPIYVISDEHRFEDLTSLIHDFNLGLSFRVKPRLGRCSVTKIENITNWGDVHVGEDGSVFIESPWNYEGLAEDMQFNGIHYERGLLADVWVGVKKNPVLGYNETLVWYFASPLAHEALGRSSKGVPNIPTVDKVPVKLEKYASWAEGLPHLLYNMYDYENQVPHTHMHDISLCFTPAHMRHFTFDMPANSLNASLYLRENLKYAIMESLAEKGKVSPLRINRLQITQTPAALQVLFTLLDKPDVVGDVVGGGEESTMNVAANLIQENLDTSQLVVLVKIANIGGEPVLQAKLVGLPGTLQEVSRDDGSTHGTENLTGYSPGDMAGLGIGMIFLGALVGYAGMSYYMSKH